MKYAIYGDSYADGNLQNLNLNNNSWATHLARRLGATTIDYHAAAGSSFYYTYQKILATQHNYDGIIVTVTEPMRYTKILEGNKFISGIDSVKTIVNYKNRQDLMGWFTSMDLDFMETAQELMIQHILELYPKAILVPCFHYSFTPARRTASGWDDFCLCAIGHEGVKAAGLEGTGHVNERGGIDGILGHIPADWHPAVAKMIKDHVVNAVKPYMPPGLQLRHPPSNYYNMTR
jgi:hypothetical protein